MTTPDPGLAPERTTLAWQRTGLSSVAAAAVCLKAFWGGHVLGLVLAGLLVAIGGLAYAAGAEAPVAPATVRAVSVTIGVAATLGVFLSIVG
ncbi:MAG TPA: DUF202 domain-containing protein [Acidimicrobiales bacterium]|nr:DUF202 domain-containing protein [Acidimicrobiales bacterium]